MLNYRQRIFLTEYLRCWKATEAARIAGYAFPRRAGSRLLTYVDIQAAIKEQLEARKMTVNEVLDRLSEQARAEYKDYIMQDGSVDIAGIVRDGKGHLIKKIVDTKWGKQVEFHDPQVALTWMGKHYQAFTERTQHEVQVRVDGLDELIKAIYHERDQG